jgi:hypothetical protein
MSDYYPLILQALSLMIGLAAWNAVRPAFRMLIILLAVTVLNEALVVPYLETKHQGYINLAYNLFSLLDMVTWFFLFYHIMSAGLMRKLTIVVAIFLLSASVTEIFLIKGWTVFHTESMRFYNLSIVLLSLAYFYNIISRRYYIMHTDPFFWICAACLIYHTLLFLNFTTLSEYNYWKMKYSDDVYYLLQNIANTCYYMLLICAFGYGIYHRHRIREHPQKL